MSDQPIWIGRGVTGRKIVAVRAKSGAAIITECGKRKSANILSLSAKSARTLAKWLAVKPEEECPANQQ